MKRKLIASILALTILTSLGCAFAAAGESKAELPIVLRYENFTRIYPTLSVSGKAATYSLSAKGALNVTKIEATLQIQKENSNGTYSNYGDSWTASAASNFLNTSGAKSVTSGGTYRLKVTVTPYIGGTKGTPETAYIT